MGLFGAKPSTQPKPRPEQSRAPAAPVGSLSIVGAGMTVRGDLESNGVVKVEGLVDGNVRAKSQVLVAKGGVVRGDVETAEAVVGGSVNGAIRAADRVEIQAGASVEGDVTTRRIAVAEGGMLNGMIRMDEHRAVREEHIPEHKGELRPRLPASMRSSVPVARIAVPPRTTTPQQPS